MTFWLLRHGVRRAPRRLLLAVLAVGFPVAMLASTLFFLDTAVHAMTRVALEPVQVEMRAVATSLDVDMTAVANQLAQVPGVSRVERFAAIDVVVGQPGTAAQATARLFAVDPGYPGNHPWVRIPPGSLTAGALLTESVLAAPGLAAAGAVTVALPGGSEPLLTLPVAGTADLRTAFTWFAIPTGEVQGDIAAVPRAVVVDYATFDRVLRPALVAELGATTPILNPGLQDLPAVDIETHVTIAHDAYPTDPGKAAAWSFGRQQLLERQAIGRIVVADDAAESLIAAKDDARNAKVLFLLIGIPGVLAAAALGLAAESALAEAHRREDALLRLRGATDGQLARLAAVQAGLAGLLGAVAGVLAALAAVSTLDGHPVWRTVPPSRLSLSVLAAVLTGGGVAAVRIVRVRRAGRRAQQNEERRVLELGWSPLWRRARLDLIALAVGLAILVVNALAGGLKQGPVEGPPLVLFFYVLLAPVLLWFGLSLLAVRGALAVLTRWSHPDSARPPRSWPATTLRWLGRRPARAGVALALGTLAVAFGTQVLGFVATYSTAKQADSRAAFGADLRLTPSTEAPVVPPATPELSATTPVRFVPARVGSDRKTLLVVDPASYAQASVGDVALKSGRGIAGLAGDPSGVLVAPEIASSFAVGPGDVLPVVVFPDGGDNSRTINLRVVGVYLSVPPSNPPSELVIGAGALPPALLPAPQTYLARVADGRSVTSAAAALQRGEVGTTFLVTTMHDQQRLEQRSLTTLDLAGLGALQAVGAGLIAALGLGVLGAFTALERRRELAILRVLGASRTRLLWAPAQEAALAVLGSLLLGVPIGLALAALSVQVLALFFALPPPLLSAPGAPLAGLLALVVGTATAVQAGVLLALDHTAAAKVLRGP